MRRTVVQITLVVVALHCGAIADHALAQELEPRAYTPSPIGAQYVVVGYSHQTGNVFVDPTLPISDIAVRLDTGSLTYGRTFGLLGRHTSVNVTLPYVLGNVKGTVFEERREIERSGSADLRMRFAVNLIGGPALTPKEFAKRAPTSTLGASLTVVAPTGQYDPARLVNIGSNRWSFKPELGVSVPRGAWRFEGTGGVWLFTENDAYFGGARFEQRPVETIQGHAIYTFRRQLWVAASATFFAGGRRVVNGVEGSTLQKNSRFGVQASIPFGSGHSLKLNWARGLTTRAGGDFTTIGVAWQYLWF
jgi:hypothetical protein